MLVRTAIDDHSYRWTWILLGPLVLYGAGIFLNTWRWDVWHLVRKMVTSHGLEPTKLSVSDEELAHQFRRYSDGRFGIRRR